MKGFLGINRVTLPRKIAVEGHRFLRLAGQQQSEGIVLWVGNVDGSSFRVTNLLIPRQTAVRSDSGICAVVEGSELRRIGMELYKEKLQLVAQVHSHPTNAYHSETDDEFAIVTTMGGLSLVVPDFAVGPFDLNEYAAYRLTESGSWEELNRREVARLIEVVDD